MLLNAAKDVASALGALINATKNASGKPTNDPATEVLKTTGKVKDIYLVIDSYDAFCDLLVMRCCHALL